ncbi:MAG: putative Ig domain-containing protein, partial [Thermoleophilia bacterium]
WLRVGTDIVGGGPAPVFNAAFTLSGATCPSPITVAPTGSLDAIVGGNLATSFLGAGGTAPYRVTTSGVLPGGVAQASDGSLTGVPTQVGTFPITVTATDSDGCRGTTGLTLRVTSADTTPAGSASSPVISSAHLSRRVFRAAGGGAASARARRRAVGTIVGYTQSLPAITTFTVVRIVPGHMSAGRCTAGPPRRRQSRCTRRVAVGSFTHTDPVGTVSVRFDGRMRGRALAPAAYLLMLAPAADGRTGRTVTLAFRIVR